MNAIQIALGNVQIDPAATPVRIRGAVNDYNARGRGSTMARRVLRNGSWEWVSAPASKGRFYAADRHDTRYGDVWIGEIVAEYTLGGRGIPEPDCFWLVTGGEPPLSALRFAKRRDGQFGLTLPDVAELLVVSDPNWR